MSKVKVKILRSQLSSVVGVAMLVVGLMAGAIAPYLATAQAPAPALPNTTANTSFPDTQNYWAQPFIQALAQRNIVTGYPNNTFRPEKSVGRDEFAAILRQAFDKAPVRQIRSGSTYTDVPDGYWASAAIKEAYEMGFMDGYPGGQFRPKQPVTKVQVLTSLARKLNLPATTAASARVAPAVTPAPATQPPANMRAKKPMMFPLAIMTLMQPFMTAPANAVAAATPPTPTASSTPPAPNGKIAISKYYRDAAQIPPNAVDAVAKTTAAGIVVNYPERRVLNPNKAATRGEVSALIHQALVYQGKITPLPSNPATNYIVGR
ncbi:S-layer homology domain-containing protein [Chamaesiphon sp.]|uniref:S-layer homology domain-containing protein n=1 Tax=Chamaesiphon sp. TaxID=2814140 RepID=UPI003594858F